MASAVAGVAIALTAVTPAAADQSVVTATVYAGTGGGVSYPEASAGTLGGCPPYSGPTQINLYDSTGSGAPQQLPAGSTWTLSTVLSCGLNVPINDVTSVQVATNAGRFESPLSSAQIVDSGQYHDPQAPGALPVIFADGSENQNTYVRPWFGGSDANAADEVIGQGTPIRLAVFENGQPLVVSITDSTVSSSKSAVGKRFSAVVHAPGGASIPASALRYSWNFGDNATAATATPRHSFLPGTYPVTVQVADVASGTGGVATIDVTADVSAAHGKHNRSGGSRRNRSSAPTGPAHSSGNHPGGAAHTGKGAAAGNGTAAHAASTQSGSKPSPRTAGKSSTTAARPAPAQPHSTSPAHRTARPASTAAPTTEVNGRLISGVTPSSPKIALAAVTDPGLSGAAPAVRQATTASSSSVLVSGVVVLVLLGLGAGYELRGRDAWRRLRLGN